MAIQQQRLFPARAIVEKVSGQTFAHFLHENLFVPMG